jgi:programmed cell death protein 5
MIFFATKLKSTLMHHGSATHTNYVGAANLSLEFARCNLYFQQVPQEKEPSQSSQDTAYCSESAQRMVDELEKIKMRKMEELRRQVELKQKLEQDKKKTGETKKKILATALEPAAFQYLEELRKRDASTAEEIENIITRLVLARQLKYRLEAIDIEALERRIKGIESKIVIKRRGAEEIDLTDKLKQDADK